MELNYKFEDWEYRMLESFYHNPEEYFDNLINKIINEHKNSCIDKYIKYCRDNDVPINYDSNEDLIAKMYAVNLLLNLHDLNTQFLNTH